VDRDARVRLRVPNPARRAVASGHAACISDRTRSDTG
jgi:hypothetical protein